MSHQHQQHHNHHHHKKNKGENQNQAQQVTITSDNLPEQIVNFVENLERRIRDRNIDARLYSEDFHKLSEKMFKNQPWPTVDIVSQYWNAEDETTYELTSSLYRELQARSLFKVVQAQSTQSTPTYTLTLQDRIDIYQNYCSLLQLLLDQDSQAPTIVLPSLWIFDLFQSFCNFMNEFHSFKYTLNQQQCQVMKATPDVWSLQAVVSYLTAFIQKGSSKDESVHIQFVYTFMYSVLCLAQIQVSLADYFSALQIISLIDLKKDLSKVRDVVQFQALLYFNLGFTYFMCRRYTDAARTLNGYIVYTHKHKYMQRNVHADLVNVIIDKMCLLLCICSTLCSEHIDEHILSDKDKYEAYTNRLAAGDMNCYEELFMLICPKYLNIPINYETYTNTNTTINVNEIYTTQARVLMNEIKSKIGTFDINTYLKSFSSINISKLASMLHVDDEHIHTALQKYKYKCRYMRYIGGLAYDGKMLTNTDTDFYIDRDMIYINTYVQTRRYGEYFMRLIGRISSQRTQSQTNSNNQSNTNQSHSYGGYYKKKYEQQQQQ